MPTTNFVKFGDKRTGHYYAVILETIVGMEYMMGRGMDSDKWLVHLTSGHTIEVNDQHLGERLFGSWKLLIGASDGSFGDERGDKPDGDNYIDPRHYDDNCVECERMKDAPPGIAEKLMGLRKMLKKLKMLADVRARSEAGEDISGELPLMMEMLGEVFGKDRVVVMDEEGPRTLRQELERTEDDDPDGSGHA